MFPYGNLDVYKKAYSVKVYRIVMVWNYKSTFGIGGLLNVGYASRHDLLMVLSSQDQGIFDYCNGEKIARIHNDLDWVGFDDTTNSVVGCDCFTR